MRYKVVSIFLMLGLWCQAQTLESVARPIPNTIGKKVPYPKDRQAKLDARRKDKIAHFIPQNKGSFCVKTPLAELYKRNMLVGGGDVSLVVRENSHFTLQDPHIHIRNTSLSCDSSSIKWGKVGKFGKSDRLSSVYLDSKYRVFVINSLHQPCNMNEFSFEALGDGIRMDSNQVVFIQPAVKFACGQVPLVQKVRITHKATNLSFVLAFSMLFESRIYAYSENKVYALVPCGVEKNKLALLYDIEAQTATVMHLPLVVNCNGKDGRDGRNGFDGANGIDSQTFKKEDGTTFTTYGTCGTNGCDGEDGENGGDGGFVLFCMSPTIYNQYGLDAADVYVHEGKGGKGGKGGAAGRNGKGSLGCYTHSGVSGISGVDGTPGDYIIMTPDLSILQFVSLESNIQKE